MRRMCWLLAASIAALPAVAVASPASGPSEQYSWSFSSGHGRLGVMLMSLTPDLRHYFGTPDDRGLLVAHVEPGTPAATAKLEPGDVITAVNKHPAHNAAEIVSGISELKKGDDVAIDLIRDHRAMTAHAVLTDAPSAQLRTPDEPGDVDRDWNNGFPDFDRMFREMMRHWPDAGHGAHNSMIGT